VEAFGIDVIFGGFVIRNLKKLGDQLAFSRLQLKII
jgi:hypothetical protein